MIDHFHGDTAGGGLGERDGGVAVERLPGFLIDFGLEGGFEALVGVVLAEEVGLAHEEAFAVVVAVDEPAGDGGGCGAPSGDQFGGYGKQISAAEWMNGQAPGAVANKRNPACQRSTIMGA